MKGRQRYVCIHCGVRLSGRPRPDGRIVPYDRAPDSDAPPEPCVCVSCVAETSRACAEGTH